jgi:hypothetical protein
MKETSHDGPVETPEELEERTLQQYAADCLEELRDVRSTLPIVGAHT